MEKLKETGQIEKLTILRAELKAWEKAFSAANNGRKASRDDIKQNPEIAAKYKEYNKTRELHAEKITYDSQSVKSVQSTQRCTPRRRKYDVVDDGSNKRKQSLLKTPSKTNSPSWEKEEQEFPSVVRNLFTPSKKSLAPTPQKDGQVLGLFDLLKDPGATSFPAQHDTIPEPSTVLPLHTSRHRSEIETHQTISSPSKKQQIRDVFATPSKNSALNGGESRTPLTGSKLNLSTPSFLRRIQPSVENDMERIFELSPQVNRTKQKPVMKGLSSILADLRDIQDERLDEDLEALREMESEEASGARPLIQPNFKPKSSGSDILQPDSRMSLLIGGLDDEAVLDGEPEITTDILRQPSKPYKKQGQKRTTRKVNLKPSRPKLAAVPEASLEEEKALETDNQKIDVQDLDDTARNFDSDSQSEYTASEGGTRYRRPNQDRKCSSAQKDKKSKTSGRKVGVKAHQNFKRLKLRNSGAKGPTLNSRYRRKK